MTALRSPDPMPSLEHVSAGNLHWLVAGNGAHLTWEGREDAVYISAFTAPSLAIFYRLLAKFQELNPGKTVIFQADKENAPMQALIKRLSAKRVGKYYVHRNITEGNHHG